MRLLFLDTSVEGAEKVAASALAGVHVVRYDSKTATQDAVLAAAPPGPGVHKSAAFFFHGQTGPAVSIFGGDPPVASPGNDFVKSFWKPLVGKTGVGTLDFLGCSLLGDPSWVQFFSVLQTEAGVTVRASDDDTGSLKKGGDWVLESHDVNVKNLYFTNVIDTWNHTLRSAISESSGRGQELSHPFDRFGPFTFGCSDYTTNDQPVYCVMHGKVRGPWTRNGTQDGTYGTNVPDTINSGADVMRVFQTQHLYLALRVDGSVTAWGGQWNGTAGLYTHEYSEEKVVKVWCSASCNGVALCLTEPGTLLLFSQWGSQRGLQSTSSAVAAPGSAANLHFEKSSDYYIDPFVGDKGIASVAFTHVGAHLLRKDGELMIFGANLAYDRFNAMVTNYSNYVNGTGTKPAGQESNTLGHGFDSLTTYKGSGYPRPVQLVSSYGEVCVIFDDDANQSTQSAICFGHHVNSTQVWVKNFKKCVVSGDGMTMLTTDGQVHPRGVNWGNAAFGNYGYAADSFRTNTGSSNLAQQGAWGVVSDAADPVVDVFMTAHTGALAITQSGKVACWGRADMGGEMPAAGTTVDTTTHKIVPFSQGFIVQHRTTLHCTAILGQGAGLGTGKPAGSLGSEYTSPQAGKEPLSFYSYTMNAGYDRGVVRFADGDVRIIDQADYDSYMSASADLHMFSSAQCLGSVTPTPGPSVSFIDTNGHVRAFGYGMQDFTNDYLQKWSDRGKTRSAALEDMTNIGLGGNKFDITKYQTLKDPEGIVHIVWDGCYIDSWSFSGWDLRQFDSSRVVTYDVDYTGALMPIPNWRLNHNTLNAIPEVIYGDDNPTIAEDSGTGASIFQGSVGSSKCIALKLYSQARDTSNEIQEDTSLNRNYVQLTELDNKVQLVRRSNTATVSEILCHENGVTNFNSDFSVRYRDTANARYQKLLHVDQAASTFRNTIQTYKDEADTTPTFSVNPTTGGVVCGGVTFADGTVLGGSGPFTIHNGLQTHQQNASSSPLYSVSTAGDVVCNRVTLSDGTVLGGGTVTPVTTISATGLRFTAVSSSLYLHSLGVYASKADMDSNTNNLAAVSGVTFVSPAGTKVHTDNQEKFDNTVPLYNGSYYAMGYANADGLTFTINFGTSVDMSHVRFNGRVHNGGTQTKFTVEYTTDDVAWTTVVMHTEADSSKTTTSQGLFNSYTSNPQDVDYTDWKLTIPQPAPPPSITFPDGTTMATAGASGGGGAAGASSSGPTIIYVDTQATGASGVTAITDTNTESNTNKYGAFWGRRGRSWTIKDEFSARPERDIAGPLFMNGQRGTGNTTTGDYNFNYIHRRYGHIDFIPQGPYRYNFTRFYMDARAGYAIASNHEFRILVSNDGATWEILKTFTLNSMTTDSSRTNSNHGIVGSDGSASMYYTSWTNTNYYSLWRIQHSDIGSGANMVTHASKYLINMDYTMNEIEWG